MYVISFFYTHTPLIPPQNVNFFLVLRHIISFLNPHDCSYLIFLLAPQFFLLKAIHLSRLAIAQLLGFISTCICSIPVSKHSTCYEQIHEVLVIFPPYCGRESRCCYPFFGDFRLVLKILRLVRKTTEKR